MSANVRYIDALSASVRIVPHYFRREDGFLLSLLNLLIAMRWLRNSVRYYLTFGRFPNYLNPTAMSEKMQFRKLFDRNPAWTILNDKLAAREYAAVRAPKLLLPKLLWSGEDPDAIPFEALPPPYVVKPNNRSRAIMFVRRPEDVDRNRMLSQCRSWLDGKPHGEWSGQWAYGQIPGRILIEELLPGSSPSAPPPNYKIFVFDGRVRFIYFSVGRYAEGGQMRGLYTSDWEKVPVDKWRIKGRVRLEGDAPKPANLDLMIDAAERIGAGLDHVRVDLYNIDGRIYLGEITPYAHSGYVAMVPKGIDLGRFPPRDLDDEFGALWTLPDVPLATRLRRGLLR